jgi:hypothetical protein
MNCQGCTLDKPCHGCEHDRRAKVDTGDKIQEIIEDLSKVFTGNAWDDDVILRAANQLVELSKPRAENKDAEILDWMFERYTYTVKNGHMTFHITFKKPINFLGFKETITKAMEGE